ncbi:MAG: SDR family oxidoreductase [Gemmatimonadetes bacterium]|nr:SDR family oxidoreductase [Gemmatimonadota bacterium]NNM05927.1 SDR family oxidoreductase [Gemmatimonadota bacterium]
MRNLIDLRGKTAVVTGGSRGIGRACAVLLAEAGASVGIGYRSRAREAEDTVRYLRELGVHAWAEAGDLATPEDARRLFQKADEEFEGLDIFVGNAAVWPPEDLPISEMDDDRWRGTLQANLDSIFFTTKEAAKRVRDNGRIVLVSSTAGQRGEAFHVDYAASKGAIISMVKGLCVELGPKGVTVNCVAPGWVDTEMARPAYGDGGREAIAATIPIGRVPPAEDIAGPIVFLCSDLARHITGEIMNVNGGAVLVG